jgi:diaminohydroxyphosphoribosylaminopyrimidine deaminase / 5-amino-6-(5-phosphoribosylamino)uracil reductase
MIFFIIFALTGNVKIVKDSRVLKMLLSELHLLAGPEFDSICKMGNEDARFMNRALELATLGLGAVSPNPMVGCVIVYRGEIIGEGWHVQYGGPHAEVNAVEKVKDKSLLPESTVYVSLEPCSHYGKTPPCADLLIRHRVKKVVVCNLDINPLVAGKGIQKIRDAGIEVEENILAEAGEEVNKRFFTYFKMQRPYIILKWAQTADGFLARENYDSKWISNEFSRKLVHKWRSEEDAVLVGRNTAQHDNPSLNVRDWSGRNPVRIVMDRDLRLSENLNLFDRTQQTLVYNLHKNYIEEQNLQYVKLTDKDFLYDLIHDLYLKKIQSVIVEGGAIVLNEFIGKGLWDEARVFVSKQIFGKGISAPENKLIAGEEHEFLDDKLYCYRNNSGT